METSLSSSELQAYYDDIDWDAFNDPRMDDATIENDLALWVIVAFKPPSTLRRSTTSVAPPKVPRNLHPAGTAMMHTWFFVAE